MLGGPFGWKQITLFELPICTALSLWPSACLDMLRWTVHGIPRVPWEAEGTFDGISTYKLDQTGKIYEHCVDNVLLRDPPMLRNPLLAGLNLQPSQTPQLGEHAWRLGMHSVQTWGCSICPALACMLWLQPLSQCMQYITSVPGREPYLACMGGNP